MTSVQHYSAAVLAALLAACAHTLIMSGTRRTATQHWIRVHTDLRVLSGYTVLIVASLLTLWAYRVLPLKIAVAIVPIQQVSILMLARMVFKERLNRSQVIGGMMIICGMLIFNVQ
jgi:small multidrug resistance pump